MTNTFKDYLKNCKSDYGNYKNPKDCLEKKTRKRLNKFTYYGRWYGGAGFNSTGAGSGPGPGTGGGAGPGDGSGGGAYGGPSGGGGASGGGAGAGGGAGGGGGA